MSSFTQFGVENVLYSIVNPRNLVIFKDNNEPYSFSDFLKNTNEEYSPTQYNDFYLSYLKQWYTAKRLAPVDEQNFIKQQYITLLKEVTLKYTTNAERRFISNIDINNPNDLEIVIPFYSRKLKSVVEFYKRGRDKTKNIIPSYKQKGTITGVERSIQSNILDYLFDNQILADNNIEYSDIQNLLDIDVEELIDTFGEYFNLPQTPTIRESELRTSLYTANYNEVDADVFLNFNSVLLKTIFNKVFLKELGFGIGINVNLSYDPFCDTNNPLGELIKRKTVGGVSPVDKIYYQQKMLEKFMGVDLHYIYKTTDGAAVSGVLISAQNPSNNLLNIKNPSTATVQSDEFIALRKLGLYFRPDHQGLLKFDVRSKTYRVDQSVLVTDVVYIYPDPEVYGNTQYSSITPIVFDVDYTQDIKFISSTFTYGDPKVETTDQPLYCYTSRQQKQSNLGTNPNEFTSGVTSLYNKGYTHLYNTDIYGNQYFLQKPSYYKNADNQYSLANTSSQNSPDTLKGKIVSGSETIFSTPVTNTTKLSVPLKSSTAGNISVKNVYTGSVNPLSSEMLYTFNKYTSAVKQELYNSVLNFDVIYDSIIIETPNYCVLETIAYTIDGFANPNTVNTYITLNQSDKLQVLSNRVFIADSNKVFFYTTSAYSQFRDDNNKIIYPTIYCYDVVGKKLSQLFPTYDSEVSSVSATFSCGVLFKSTTIPQQVNITHIDQATLSYNSYNNCFNMVYIGKDSNDAYYLFNHNFNIDNNKVTLTNSYVVDTQGDNLTIRLAKNTSNFYALTSSNTQVTNIPGTPDQAIYKIETNLTVGTVLTGPNLPQITIDNSNGTLNL